MKPTLVVLAAGMGSRYGSLKQVEGLGPAGETIIDYSVFDAMKAGFGKVVFIIRKSIEKEFKEVFDNRYKGHVPYELVFQELDMLPEGFKCPADRVKPWGTGHAVWTARNAVKEPFAVINADDFYGAASFEILAKALSNPNLAPGSFFMAGYRLGNTLSEQGAVSRGVCTTDAEGFLKTVVERTHIERIEEKVYYRNEEQNQVEVDENLPVSMNFWGFTTDYFNHCEKMFSEFLKTSIDNPKSEFYIPLVVNNLISTGDANCQVLPTTAEWFGVTYPGDRPAVVEKLRQMAANGTYPSPLW